MKKPEIFKPKIGNINNNKKTYCSFIEDKLGVEKEEHIESFEEPIDFINRLGSDGGYIFSKTVVIETKDATYETKIAGKLGNKIATLDNKVINIDDIIKIYEKN